MIYLLVYNLQLLEYLDMKAYFGKNDIIQSKLQQKYVCRGFIRTQDNLHSPTVDNYHSLKTIRFLFIATNFMSSIYRKELAIAFRITV